jgi:predicted amidophosphoribosyltransferase
MLDLPTLCAVCRGWSAGRLCADCRTRHAAPRLRCGTCARPLASAARCGACIASPPPFAHAIAAVDYAFPWSGLVTALKFHAGLEFADAMAALLTDAVRRDGAPLPSLVTAVPLGRSRLAERGHNQSWELARRVARSLRFRSKPALLESRGASMRMHGQSIALVDDVVTTGATAGEAARTLLAAGASSVQLWAFSRTA